jgi:hypothetical protein
MTLEGDKIYTFQNIGISLKNLKRNNWLKCIRGVEQEFPFKCQRLG